MPCFFKGIFYVREFPQRQRILCEFRDELDDENTQGPVQLEMIYFSPSDHDISGCPTWAFEPPGIEPQGVYLIEGAMSIFDSDFSCPRVSSTFIQHY